MMRGWRVGVLGMMCCGTLATAMGPMNDARACVAVGQSGFLTMTGEEALIVWDAEAGAQHFIRTAAFPGMTRDFGFLVPTPSQPTLAEVDNAVFDRLFAMYEASTPRGVKGGNIDGAKSVPQSVEVLERKVVAGLDAAVLRANDPAALQAWLGKHGYPASDALTAWLAPYVEKGWVVTAFRVEPAGAGPAGFAMKAVRMSFKTDVPFFPYSEPAQEGVSPRPFRVSVVAKERMRVRADFGWGGTVGYAGRPGKVLAELLSEVAPGAQLGEEAWLTVFDEPQSVRGKKDLFFERAIVQWPVPPKLRTKLAL